MNSPDNPEKLDKEHGEAQGEQRHSSPRFISLIDELEHLVENSQSIFHTKMVNEERFFVLTTRLKSALPDDIKNAVAALSPISQASPPPQRLHREDALLLIVDMQERLVSAMFDAEGVAKNCATLAAAARQLQIPIVVTEQYPEKLGSTLSAISEAAALDELDENETRKPHSKMRFSACTETVLNDLRAANCSTILLCGIESHVCVLQSTLDLIKDGFTVFVAYDAISSRQEYNKQVGWERMLSAGAIPTSTESAVFELLREAGTPDFKALLPLIK